MCSNNRVLLEHKTDINGEISSSFPTKIHSERRLARVAEIGKTREAEVVGDLAAGGTTLFITKR